MAWRYDVYWKEAAPRRGVPGCTSGSLDFRERCVWKQKTLTISLAVKERWPPQSIASVKGLNGAFKNQFGDVDPFCGATGIPLLDVWKGFQNQMNPSLGSHGFLRFASECMKHNKRKQSLYCIYPWELLLVGVRLDTVVDVESVEYLLDLPVTSPPEGYLQQHQQQLLTNLPFV